MQAFTLQVREDSIAIAWPDGASGSFSWLWRPTTKPPPFRSQTEERVFDLISVSADRAACAFPVRWRFPAGAADSVEPLVRVIVTSSTGRGL